jgi:hypothetical protein
MPTQHRKPRPIPWDRLIDCDDAAAITGHHPRYLPTLLKTGRLEGRKIGKVWIIDRTSAERLAPAK